MNNLEKFTNLLVMALVDGSLTEREFKFLLSRSARWGITEQEFTRGLEYAGSPGAELRIPARKTERAAMLQDLLRMMAADGDLAAEEKQLFSRVAAQLRLSSEELNQIIDSVLPPKTRRS